MKIASICRRRIVTVDRASSASEAAGLMLEHHVGALIVTEAEADETRVTGVVTDRDLTVDLLARGLDGTRIAIGELASPVLASVGEDDDVSDAVAAMQANGVRRLLVVDADQRLTGIVAFDDLLAACAADMAGLAEVIRSGIARESADTVGPAVPASPTLRVPAVGTTGWGNPLG